MEEKSKKVVKINVVTFLLIIVLVIVITAVVVMLVVSKTPNRNENNQEKNLKESESNQINNVANTDNLKNEVNDADNEIEPEKDENNKVENTTANSTTKNTEKTLSGDFMPYLELPGDPSSYYFSDDGSVIYGGNDSSKGTYEFDGKTIKIHFTSYTAPEEINPVKIDEYKVLQYIDEDTIKDENGNEYYRNVTPQKSDFVGKWKLYKSYPDVNEMEVFGSIGPGVFEIDSDGTYFDGIDPSSHDSDAVKDVSGTYTIDEGTITLTSYNGKKTYMNYNRGKLGYYYENYYFILEK